MCEIRQRTDAAFFTQEPGPLSEFLHIRTIMVRLPGVYTEIFRLNYVKFWRNLIV